MHQLRFIFHTALLLLHPIVAMQQVGSFLKEQIPHPQQPASETTGTRKLQQSTFNYRANYTADFLHLLDPSCSGDVPVLVVTCLQAQNMTILKTSNESIICVPENIDFTSTGYDDALSYRCFNTCNGTSCNGIFISNIIDGPYGSIQFMCEGNDYQEVEAAYVYIGGDNGSCNATSNGSTQSRNLHIARLGVSCPSETSSGDGGATRQYVYDDSYFECSFNCSSDAFVSAVDSTGDPSDVYTCQTGGDCGGNACSDVVFSDIVIRSDVLNFVHLCVNPIYGVRFEALWGNLYDSQTALTTCRYDNTGIQISCGNGATAIRFNSSTDSSMKCTYVNDIDLHCIGSETNIKGQFTSVMYDCFGGSVPTSLVFFPETNVSCDNNNMNVDLQNSLIMGLSCEGEPTLYYSDLLFECTNPGSQFYVSESGFLGLVGDRFICSESTMITNGSSASDMQIIPSVSITADRLWRQDTTLQGQCLKIVDSIPTLTISTVPSIAPTPSKKMSGIPNVQAPTAPSFNNSVPTATSSVSSPSVSTIIAGILGGMAILLVATFFHRKSQNNLYCLKFSSNTTGSHRNDPLDRLTEGNSDQQALVRASANNCAADADDIQRNEQIRNADHRFPTDIAAQPNNEAAAPFRDVEYKDQVRSVNHNFPVNNVAQRVDEAVAAPFRDVEYKDQARSVNHNLPTMKAAQRVYEGAPPIRSAIEDVDQAQNGDHSFPVVNTAQCVVDDGAATYQDDVPLATAVHVTDNTVAD